MRGLWKGAGGTAVIIFLLTAGSASAQDFSKERTFPQAKAQVEIIAKTLRASMAGRLPTLEGFVLPGERSLDRFQRPYYQSDFQVIAVSSASSLVRVNSKITAWYADPIPSRSGYRVLPSNGRLESDLLDQLADAMSEGETARSPATTPEPSISAPVPRIPETNQAEAVAAGNPSLKTQTDAAEKREQELAAEAKSLEEILQNQAHPTNLVAVKKNGVPVLRGGNVNAEVLFTATAGDEFEVLDENSSWVHVRISGLSRGWIRRSSLEMPDDLARSNSKPGGAAQNYESFHVSSEQIAPFPANWEPLRGKLVRIVTVQKTAEDTKPDSKDRLAFAKGVLMKQYEELAATTDPPSGVVLIFDSDDGGMLAATNDTLKSWQAEKLTDDRAWKQCFFDPPELLGTR